MVLAHEIDGRSHDQAGQIASSPLLASGNELATLYRRVVDSAAVESDRNTFLVALVQQAVSATSALGGAYFLVDGSDKLLLGPRALSRELLAQRPDIGHELGRHADSARQSGRASVEVLARGQRNLTAILAPVRTENGGSEVISVVVSLLAEQPLEPFLVVLQLFAGYVNLWEARAAASALAWQVDTSSAIVELLGHVQTADDFDAACVELTGRVRALLGCDEVAIAVREPGRGRCRLSAVAGLSEFDRRSFLTRAREAACDEALAQGSLIEWPPASPAAERVLHAHRKLYQACGAARLLTTPLRYGEQHKVGALVCSWSTKPDDLVQPRNIATALGAPLGAALGRFMAQRAGGISHALKTLSGRGAGWRPFLFILVLVSLALVLMWPVPFRVSADATLQPLGRRFVVAPFDGILSEVRVKPGEIVPADALLARMDGRDLEYRLSELRAEYAAADKDRDIKMARGDVSGAQIANLEMQRVQIKIDTLQGRLENLTLRSPIAGMVISEDLGDLVGSPVKIGRTLFEVASLAKLRVELAIPDEDIAYVETGQRVRLSLNAMPGAERHGVLERIAPRARVQDGDNVFVGRYQVDNLDQTLRPGMQGEGAIRIGKRPLGWVLFHRPWERVANWAGVPVGEFGEPQTLADPRSALQRASLRLESSVTNALRALGTQLRNWMPGGEHGEGE